MKLLPNILVLAGTVSAGALSSPWMAWPANATGNGLYETVTVTALTTYCPEATVLTHNGAEYTVTTETTLTITDCPCTLTRPIQPLTPTTILYTSCPPENTVSPANGANNGNGGNNNGGNNGGNVATAPLATVTNALENNPANTYANGGAANPTSGPYSPNELGNGGNGTVFTGQGARVGAGLGLGFVLGGVMGLVVLL